MLSLPPFSSACPSLTQAVNRLNYVYMSSVYTVYKNVTAAERESHKHIIHDCRITCMKWHKFNKATEAQT